MITTDAIGLLKAMRLCLILSSAFQFWREVAGKMEHMRVKNTFLAMFYRTQEIPDLVKKAISFWKKYA